MGVPLSVLRGERAPAQRWTARDSMLAQALTLYESMICPGCGQPLWLSMDPETERRWHAPMPTRCHACTAIYHRSQEYSDPAKIEAPPALRFHADLTQPVPSPPPT